MIVIYFDLTNEYYKILEDNEALRHEILEQKRELLRANVSRFERVSRPALLQPRGMLESLFTNEGTNSLSGIAVPKSHTHWKVINPFFIHEIK